MVKPIMQDPIFLARKSERAEEEDVSLAQDLLDTLEAHQQECVGMAANMIGVSKCVIAFEDGGKYTAMLNPEILAKSDPYEAEEGCLSLPGKRKTTRYAKIKVSYQNMKMQQKMRTFTGFTAQIIQHEMDHLQGILI